MFCSTREIVEDLSYLRGGAFSAAFESMWDAVSSQILKLETRQVYDETGNPSFDAFKRGDWDEALRLIPASHADDVALYGSFHERKIDFMRCRPVVFPVGDYIKWEFENYKFNQSLGERIFIANYLAVDVLFQRNAQHDFMIFDTRLAAIYDHDDAGRFIGGWVSDDVSTIAELQKLFIFIKANSSSFEHVNL